MDERFGRSAASVTGVSQDIHASGDHLISLLGDLPDLSKIETGKLDLTFVSVNLNNLVQQCVAIMRSRRTASGSLSALRCPQACHRLLPMRSMRR